MNDQKQEELRDRILTVEQQLSHQKEVLSEINEAIKEVVKTQNILANQSESIERLTKESEQVRRRVHEMDLTEARRRVEQEMNDIKTDALHKEIKDILRPATTKHTSYFKWIGIALGGVWALVLIFLKVYLEAGH